MAFWFQGLLQGSPSPLPGLKIRSWFRWLRNGVKWLGLKLWWPCRAFLFQSWVMSWNSKCSKADWWDWCLTYKFLWLSRSWNQVDLVVVYREVHGIAKNTSTLSSHIMTWLVVEHPLGGCYVLFKRGSPPWSWSHDLANTHCSTWKDNRLET